MNAEDLGATALVVIQDGVETVRVGDSAAPVLIHSIRKSLMSLLIGVAVDQGQLSTDATLAQLGIDDRTPLSTEERGATVADLLTCRSGVYLPVEPHPLAPPRPPRGSARPGTLWHYNNWDANALGAIYERVTGKSVYVAFDRLIATPLGLQDWDPYAHSAYLYEPDPLGANLTFPNYSFRLSARDMARVGELYLGRGTWAGHTVVSADWIDASTRPLAVTTFPIPTMQNYGYLWWVAGADAPGLPADAFTAWGLSGSFLTVIPSRATVVSVVTEPASTPDAALIQVAPHVYAEFLADLLAARAR